MGLGLPMTYDLLNKPVKPREKKLDFTSINKFVRRSRQKIRIIEALKKHSDEEVARMFSRSVSYVRRVNEAGSRTAESERINIGGSWLLFSRPKRGRPPRVSEHTMSMVADLIECELPEGERWTGTDIKRFLERGLPPGLRLTNVSVRLGCETLRKAYRILEEREFAREQKLEEAIERELVAAREEAWDSEPDGLERIAGENFSQFPEMADSSGVYSIIRPFDEMPKSTHPWPYRRKPRR